MNQVGNDENSVTSERPHPVVYTNPLQDDEIDLVDLWIVLWSYRKLFLSSVILVAVVGILCFEFAYDPKSMSTVHSILEIESFIDDGKRISIVDPDVLIKRIEYSKLPRFSSLGEFEQIKPLIMATSISRIKKGSGIVEIVTKVPAGEIADSSRFHGQLVDEILLELKESAELIKVGIQDNLFSAKRSIVNLRGLIIALEQDLPDGTDSQVASNQSLQDEITLRKANIQSEIDILTERVKYLELTLSNTGSLVLLKAGVSGNPTGVAKPVAYSIILMLSLFLALLLTMSVIFARKVKERMAGGD
jgi:hypothetical protein